MAEWQQKRFWTAATTAAVDGGHAVRLDGRTLRTPAKAALVVPTAALAQAIAAEWEAQNDRVDAATMPLTRTANSALDKLHRQRAEVAAMLGDYGDSDLLCYRAASPAELVARQAAAWDPVLDWAAATLGARLASGAGIMHIVQPPEATARLRAEVDALDPWHLAAFHDLVALSGSLVLALAVTRNARSPGEAWSISRIDEAWQTEQWGEDDLATASSEHKKRAFEDAARFWRLLAHHKYA